MFGHSFICSVYKVEQIRGNDQGSIGQNITFILLKQGLAGLRFFTEGKSYFSKLNEQRQKIKVNYKLR